eukprot:COSAG05_NODE_2123_length_3527_cov_6.845974_4_plen_171_part_00
MLLASEALPPDWDVFLLNWYCFGPAKVAETDLEAAQAMLQQIRKDQGQQRLLDGNTRDGQDQWDALKSQLSTEDLERLEKAIETDDPGLLKDADDDDDDDDDQGDEPDYALPPPGPATSQRPISVPGDRGKEKTWGQYCEKNAAEQEISPPGSGLIKVSTRCLLCLVDWQ